MADREALAERAVVKWARRHGFIAVKVKFEGFRGVHDRLFISLEGQHIYIEFKKAGKKARKNQEWWQNEFRRRGVACYTNVRTREYGIAILSQFLN